uniref:Ice-binding protein C-terminal domain-containing protein n=1 Tax=Nostoc flagelliforme str. Sunitezuoqi TaxID=676037 RepID=E7DQA4_9NOSO|nr:hypothetical protein Nfla_8104 [Nostoc flagelliforme str. Sunitezuoqi]
MRISYPELRLVNLGSTITLKGQALVSGSIEVPQEVPEPKTMMPLISIGLIGASFIVRRRYRPLAG